MKKRIDGIANPLPMRPSTIESKSTGSGSEPPSPEKMISQSEKFPIEIRPLDVVNQYLENELKKKSAVLYKAELPAQRIRQIITELIEMPTQAIGPFVDRNIVTDAELIDIEFDAG